MSFKQLCGQNTIKRKSVKPNPSDQQLREQAFSQRLMLIESDLKVQRIGARTGQQFIIDESGWPKLQGELQCSYEPSPFPSWAPSERGSNQISERISERYLEPIKDEILHKKASQLLEEFNIAEKLKQERDFKSQDRVLTDSLINIDQSSQKKLEKSPKKFDDEQPDLVKKKSSLGAQSVAEWINCLPFCTPSKLSDLTEMVSRSRAQLSFNLGLSPICQNQSNGIIESIKKQKPPLNLPPLHSDNKESFNYSNVNLKITLKPKSISKMVDEGVYLQKNTNSVSTFTECLKREGQIFDEKMKPKSPKKIQFSDEDNQIKPPSDFSMLFVPIDSNENQSSIVTSKYQKKTKKGSKKQNAKQPQRVPEFQPEKIKDELSQNNNFQCSPHFYLPSQVQEDQQVRIDNSIHEMNFTFHEEVVPGKRVSKKDNLQKIESELSGNNVEKVTQKRGRKPKKEKKITEKVNQAVGIITLRKSDRQRRPNLTMQINHLFYNQGVQIKQNTRPQVRKFEKDSIKDERASRSVSPNLSPNRLPKNKKQNSDSFDSKKFFKPGTRMQNLDMEEKSQFLILQELLLYLTGNFEKQFQKLQCKIKLEKGKQSKDFIIILNSKSTISMMKCKKQYMMEVAMIKPCQDQQIKIGKRIYKDFNQITFAIKGITKIINDSSSKMFIVIRFFKQ